ncbi:MAG: hypothetical protein ASARMPRED_004960 [Alectoria sarmentosa]|nr:MAG: hypothetical protein ASARMPRED_004960 [Alectoria sarmentosa]
MAGPTRRKWSPISLVKKLRHRKLIKALTRSVDTDQPEPINDEQERQSNADQVGQLYGRPNGQTNAPQHAITPAPATTLVPLIIQHYVLAEDANGHPTFQSNHTFITVPSTTISLVELQVHIWAALCARDEPNNPTNIPYEAAAMRLTNADSKQPLDGACEPDELNGARESQAAKDGTVAEATVGALKDCTQIEPNRPPARVAASPSATPFGSMPNSTKISIRVMRNRDLHQDSRKLFNGYDFISVSPSITFSELKNAALEVFQAQNQKVYPGSLLTVERLDVHWGGIFDRVHQPPISTEISEEYIGAVLEFLDKGHGYDFIKVFLAGWQVDVEI